MDSPVLNTGNKFIGKYKGAWVLWIRTLERYDLIKPQPDKVYTQLINSAGYELENSTFRKYNTRAADLYELNLNTLLSQVAHKRKLGKLN